MAVFDIQCILDWSLVCAATRQWWGVTWLTLSHRQICLTWVARLSKSWGLHRRDFGRELDLNCSYIWRHILYLMCIWESTLGSKVDYMGAWRRDLEERLTSIFSLLHRLWADSWLPLPLSHIYWCLFHTLRSVTSWLYLVGSTGTTWGRPLCCFQLAFLIVSRQEQGASSVIDHVIPFFSL